MKTKSKKKTEEAEFNDLPEKKEIGVIQEAILEFSKKYPSSIIFKCLGPDTETSFVQGARSTLRGMIEEVKDRITQAAQE